MRQLVVSALVGLLAVAGCSTPAGVQAPAGSAGTDTQAAAPSAPAAGVAAPGSHGKLPQITGRISAVNGSSWTVLASDGKTYTVTITPQTVFGSHKHPATREQFTPGSQTRIRGTPNTANPTTFTAIQVRLPSARAAQDPP